MFKSWYSNFYNQLRIIQNNNSNNEITEVKQAKSIKDNNILIFDVDIKNLAQKDENLLKAQNSSKGINKKINKFKFKNKFKTKNKEKVNLINNNEINNQEIDTKFSKESIDFSNLFTNSFKSLVHYGDNIGAKIVKCLINESFYEAQSLINQEYDIYQVILKNKINI